MVFENKQNRLKNLKVKQKVYIKVNKINKVIDSNSILLNPGLINSYIHRLGGEDIDALFYALLHGTNTYITYHDLVAGIKRVCFIAGITYAKENRSVLKLIKPVENNLIEKFEQENAMEVNLNGDNK